MAVRQAQAQSKIDLESWKLGTEASRLLMNSPQFVIAKKAQPTAAIHELEGVSEGVIVDGHVATLRAMTEMRTRSLPYPRQSGGLGLSSRNDSL